MTEIDVELLLGAEIEFLEIYSRRGEIFLERFECCLTQLASFPHIGPVYSAPFRRLLVPQTPIGIFYTVEGRRILVQAVLDLRMSPDRIAERMAKPSRR